MAKAKTIPDQIFIELINTFFESECNYDPKKLKFPKIIEYVNNNGYPDYKVTSLRRNESIRNYIDSLIASYSDRNYKIVSTYKTLDVEAFLSTNKTHSSLVRALTELDTYHRTVAEAAIKIDKKNKNLEKEIDKLKNKLKELEQTASLAKEQSTLSISEQKSLKAENKKLRQALDDYIYPEIANELLVEEGFLKKNDSIIDTKSLDKKIINADTSIYKGTQKVKSDVIKNLFGDFDE